MTFNNLLQDRRVRSEQSKYENITRQRSTVMSKYKRVYQEFLDLEAGLDAAKKWYSEMKDTVNSLDKNVETFVNNRRSEGAQLLNQIEQDRANNSGGQADRERERLRGLMERMSMDPSTSPSGSKPPPPRPQSSSHSGPGSGSAQYPTTNFTGQYQLPASSTIQPASAQSNYSSYSSPQPNSYYPQQSSQRTDVYGQGRRPISQSQGGYDPASYLRRDSNQPISPPPNQQQFPQSSYGYQQMSPQQQIPPGYVPPPPPPGPPPLGPQQTFQQPSMYPTAQGNYAQAPGHSGQPRPGQQPSSIDPWAGLNAWK
jgi:hypothetical protein